jgi:hypothetical protein
MIHMFYIYRNPNPYPIPLNLPNGSALLGLAGIAFSFSIPFPGANNGLGATSN